MVEAKWLDLDKAFAELERELTGGVRGLAAVAFESVLEKTPQFYGRMVASWNYSLNSPDFTDRSQEAYSLRDPTAENSRQAFKAGDRSAIAIAIANNVGKDARFRLGDTVYFSNGVDHGEGAYSQAIEDGEILLRPVNLPGRPVGRTIDGIQQQYAQISYGAFETLKTKRIGE